MKSARGEAGRLVGKSGALDKLPDYTNCGLRNAECGLAIRNPQSAIRNPQSEIRNQKAPRVSVTFNVVVSPRRTCTLAVNASNPSLRTSTR